MIKEKRRHPRFRKDLPIVIRHPYNETKINIADVSLGGVAVKHAVRHYDIDRIVKLEIMLSGASSILCDAKVVSITPRSKHADTYKVVMQFVGMADKDREKLKACIESPCRFMV